MNFQWKKLTNGEDAMFNRINISIDDIPVCLEVLNSSTNEVYKTFGVFKSAHQFLNYIADTPLFQRCFFEIIRGAYPQKHYVDIDIPITDDNLTERYPHSKEEKLTIASIIVDEYKRVLLDIKKEISEEDILVFNSNAETKRSYHIIVDRWYFPSATQNRDLFESIMERIPLEYHKYFDFTMYKSIQQFRTMFSTKVGKNRFKVLDSKSTWKLKGNFKNEAMKMRELFYASLVTELNGTCRMLSFEYKEKIAYVPSRTISNMELSVIINFFKSNFNDADSFDVTDVKNSLISLRRKRPSYCSVCLRQHESENPFLFVNYENILFFNCRRNDESQKICDLKTADDGTIINNIEEHQRNVYLPPKIDPPRQKMFIKPLVEDVETENNITEFPHLTKPNVEIQIKHNKQPEQQSIIQKQRVLVSEREKTDHELKMEQKRKEMQERYKIKKPNQTNINGRLSTGFDQIQNKLSNF